MGKFTDTFDAGGVFLVEEADPVEAEVQACLDIMRRRGAAFVRAVRIMQRVEPCPVIAEALRRLKAES